VPGANARREGAKRRVEPALAPAVASSICAPLTPSQTIAWIVAGDIEMMTAEHATHEGLDLSESDIERRKRYVGLEPVDLARLVSARAVVAAGADRYVSEFFDYLRRFEETATLFAERKRLEEARDLKRAHLAAMVQGLYERPYVEQRLRLARLYSSVGLDVPIFLGAYCYLLSAIGTDIEANFAEDRDEALRIFIAVRKIGFFDMAIVIDFLLSEREQTIALQQGAIQELSTPVLQLRERLLLLPIIGSVDTRRARLLTDALLVAIRSTRAKVVLMDLTGVPAINAEAANHLMQMVEAARLIGVVVIASGLSAAVSKALVELKVGLPALDIVGDLQSGMERSERLLGFEVVRTGAAARAATEYRP
jgi:rsbT co-antagonist protein RsbR